MIKTTKRRGVRAHRLHRKRNPTRPTIPSQCAGGLNLGAASRCVVLGQPGVTRRLSGLGIRTLAAGHNLRPVTDRAAHKARREPGCCSLSGGPRDVMAASNTQVVAGGRRGLGTFVRPIGRAHPSRAECPFRDMSLRDHSSGGSGGRAGLARLRRPRRLAHGRRDRTQGRIRRVRPVRFALAAGGRLCAVGQWRLEPSVRDLSDGGLAGGVEISPEMTRSRSARCRSGPVPAPWPARLRGAQPDSRFPHLGRLSPPGAPHDAAPAQFGGGGRDLYPRQT
jgi:hypothetical protein